MYVLLNTKIVYVCLESQLYNRTTETRTVKVKFNWFKQQIS